MRDTTAQRRVTLLVYADIAASTTGLVRIFGLGAGRVDRDERGRAVHGEAHAGDGVIWMHPAGGAGRPGLTADSGAATVNVAVMVNDVDAHHRRATAEARGSSTSRSTRATATASTPPATSKATSGRS